VTSQTIPVTPIRKVAAITGFFAAVGPPLAALVLSLFMAVALTFQAIVIGSNPYDVIAILATVIMMGVFMVPPSYVLGIVPACVAGLAVGVLQVYRRSNPVTVIAVGALVGISYEVALRKFFANLTSTFASPSRFPSMTLICVVATFLCWRGIRNWYVNDAQADEGPL
jgi:hypothetical protein